MTYRIDQAARVGHVNLKASDLERSIAFYSDVLGFELHQRTGKGGAFLGAADFHDPDSNLIELYRDPLDLDDLLAEAD